MKGTFVSSFETARRTIQHQRIATCIGHYEMKIYCHQKEKVKVDGKAQQAVEAPFNALNAGN
jgi:hypothetical protein